MTPKLKRFSAATAAIVLTATSLPSAFAQKPVLQVRGQQTAQQSEEEQKAGQEIEKKALSLLDELISESGSLTLAENRIHVQSSGVEMLWKFDEPRARALVREVMGQIVALSQEYAAQAGDPVYNRPSPQHRDNSHLRQRLLRFLATRDSKLALEFLRATRSPQTAEMRPPGLPDPERHLELQLAAQAADSDPQFALQLAEESIAKDLNYQTIDLWNAVQRKDPRAGARLAGEIVGKLKSADLLSAYDKLQLAFNMLHRLKRLTNENAQTEASRVNLAEMQQAFREILELVVSAAFTITSSTLLDQSQADRARNLLAQLRGFLPDIDKHLPSRAAAIRAKFAQFDKAMNRSPQQKFYEEFNVQMNNKSSQEILALASKAPAEVRDHAYIQAAQRAVGEGDIETARRIVKENVRDKLQANQILASIEHNHSERAAHEGKFDVARGILAKLRSNEERASFLARWALMAANKGDQKGARQFIEEARGLLGDRMQSQLNLQAQISIANAAVTFDPDSSFAIAEAAIERLNRVIAAGLEMAAFDRGQEGEMQIESGELHRARSSGFDQLLNVLAQKDFDRTAGLLRQWQPVEVRMAMSLMLLESIFSGQFAHRPPPPPPFRRTVIERIH